MYRQDGILKMMISSSTIWLVRKFWMIDLSELWVVIDLQYLQYVFYHLPLLQNIGYMWRDIKTIPRPWILTRLDSAPVRKFLDPSLAHVLHNFNAMSIFHIFWEMCYYFISFPFFGTDISPVFSFNSNSMNPCVKQAAILVLCIRVTFTGRRPPEKNYCTYFVLVNGKKGTRIPFIARLPFE